MPRRADQRLSRFLSSVRCWSAGLPRRAGRDMPFCHIARGADFDKRRADGDASFFVGAPLADADAIFIYRRGAGRMTRRIHCHAHIAARVLSADDGRLLAIGARCAPFSGPPPPRDIATMVHICAPMGALSRADCRLVHAANMPRFIIYMKRCARHHESITTRR